LRHLPLVIKQETDDLLFDKETSRFSNSVESQAYVWPFHAL